MYTILGLGNPGEEYANTRHNAGRVVLNDVMKAWGWGKQFRSAELGGEVSEGAIAGAAARVLFPDTYMNHSGKSAKKAGVEGLIVVYDEVDLPFGEFKLAYGRGAGGHNGLKSVIDELGTADFLRIRIGIASRNWFGRVVRPRGDRLADYVLGELTKKERSKLEEVGKEVAKALESVVKEGKEKAMTNFN